MTEELSKHVFKKQNVVVFLKLILNYNGKKGYRMCQSTKLVCYNITHIRQA